MIVLSQLIELQYMDNNNNTKITSVAPYDIRVQNSSNVWEDLSIEYTTNR